MVRLMLKEILSTLVVLITAVLSLTVFFPFALSDVVEDQSAQTDQAPTYPVIETDDYCPVSVGRKDLVPHDHDVFCAQKTS